MRSLQQFWSVRRVTDDRVTLARLGTLRLWLARAEREWGFAVEHAEPTQVMDIAQVPEDVVPAAMKWTNAAFREAPREFCLKASVPDRSVVVKPEHPVTLPREESATLFVAVPAFIQLVLLNSRREVVLGRIASLRMSDTWFGSPQEGELCYSLPGPATLDRESLTLHPHEILCSLEVTNHSEEPLVLEKLCLRTDYMTLYCGASHLWSSMVKIQHEGSFKGTQVRYPAGQPPYESNLMELTKPLKREERGIYRLTFGSGFGKDIIFGR